jgi:hypothetical protein
VSLVTAVNNGADTALQSARVSHYGSKSSTGVRMHYPKHKTGARFKMLVCGTCGTASWMSSMSLE